MVVLRILFNSSSGSTTLLLEKIGRLIGIKRRSQLFKLSFLMILSGFCEIISLVSIVPFLTALTNPQIIWNIKLFNFYPRVLNCLHCNYILFLMS